MSQGLIDRVLAVDYEAILAAREAGPPAAAALAPLASDRDAEVRELVLHCLAETGGPEAVTTLAGALLDREPMVRAAAMRGLHRLAPATAPGAPAAALAARLLDAFDRSDDPVVRGNAALLYARLPGASATELIPRRRRETDAEAADGCVAALARLGDPNAIDEFIARLHGSSGSGRARLLERAADIPQERLLRPLLPLLDDETPAIRIGVDGAPFQPDHVRICDLAVALAAALSGHTFSFPVDRRTNFRPEQLGEVREFLRRLP